MVAQIKKQPVTIYRVTCELQKRRGTKIVETDCYGEQYHHLTYDTAIEKLNFPARPTMEQVQARLAELGYAPKTWGIYQAHTRPLTPAQALGDYIGADRF